MEQIDVPIRLRKFSMYKGFLVHFTVWVCDDGVPDFRVIHEENRMKCMKNKLCALCGEPLGNSVMVFIGGSQSLENGIFTDGPMHESCAKYAGQVCPFLANADYAYSKDQIRRLLEKGETVCEYKGDLIQGDDSPDRPAIMGLYYTPWYNVIQDGSHLFYQAGAPIKINLDFLPRRTNGPKTETPNSASSQTEDATLPCDASKQQGTN